jgi:hypothetical protein
LQQEEEKKRGNKTNIPDGIFRVIIKLLKFLVKQLLLLKEKVNFKNIVPVSFFKFYLIFFQAHSKNPDPQPWTKKYNGNFFFKVSTMRTLWTCLLTVLRTNCRTRQRQQRGRRLLRTVKRKMDKMDR